MDIADEQIDDLRGRILATRWPSKEARRNRSQGVSSRDQGARPVLTEDYDFGRMQARDHCVSQVHVEIDA